LQLDRILAAGYRIVSLSDAIAGKIEGKANIAITIDDGNHSVYRAWKEVFEPRGIRPDLFIYPNAIDRNAFTLTSDRLRELAAAGCGIGAHGYFHEYMTPKAWARNPARVTVEAVRPGPALEKMLGTRPSLFAYPFGVTSSEAEAALQKAGYSWAFLAGDTLTSVDFSDPGLRRYAVPRTIVYRWNRETVLKTLESRMKP
jgi:peptidoglycan/xylan/chitin deacetylase (PgdA/CDA1 family)